VPIIRRIRTDARRRPVDLRVARSRPRSVAGCPSLGVVRVNDVSERAVWNWWQFDRDLIALSLTEGRFGLLNECTELALTATTECDILRSYRAS
jgi:hypothetical protein